MFYKPSQRTLFTVHPIYLRYTDWCTQMQPVVLNLAQNSFTSKYKNSMHKTKGTSSYYIIR